MCPPHRGNSSLVLTDTPPWPEACTVLVEACLSDGSAVAAQAFHVLEGVLDLQLQRAAGGVRFGTVGYRYTVLCVRCVMCEGAFVVTVVGVPILWGASVAHPREDRTKEEVYLGLCHLAKWSLSCTLVPHNHCVCHRAK